MVGKTRNTVIVQARKRADELAAKRRDREKRLSELATAYLVETMTATRLIEDAEIAAAALVTTAKEKAETARERGKATVLEMLATGETRNGVAELLDVSVSYVRGIEVAATKGEAKKDVDAQVPADESATSE